MMRGSAPAFCQQFRQWRKFADGAFLAFDAAASFVDGRIIEAGQGGREGVQLRRRFNAAKTCQGFQAFD